MDQKRPVFIGTIVAGRAAGRLLPDMTSTPPPPPKVVQEEPKFATTLAAATPINRGELPGHENLTRINVPPGKRTPEHPAARQIRYHRTAGYHHRRAGAGPPGW